MLIRDIEQKNEAPILEQLLENLRLEIRAWLRRKPLPEARTARTVHDQNHPEGLIL